MICIKFETTEILKILHFYRHWQTTAFGLTKHYKGMLTTYSPIQEGMLPPCTLETA